MKVIYLGVFLTAESREQLLARFPPAFTDVHADHVTLIFRPTDEERAALPLGKVALLEVIGISRDEKAQAVLIRGVESRNAHPHITISTAPGTKPVYSNELLARGGWEPVTGVTLEGIYDTFPRTAP
jgi:hypothetical protein